MPTRVTAAMSWWWEEIHAARLYPIYTALRAILEPGGWGAGTWEPLAFETAGPPPETVGDPLLHKTRYRPSCDLL